MDTLTAIAASGMRARLETLDVLANNMANTGTAGYKADQEAYNLYFGEDAWSGYDEGRPPTSEMPIIERNWTDLSQGILQDTGSSSDLALASEGFFVVQTQSGLLYTRNGQFKVSRNGALVTQEGYQVMGKSGNPIQLQPDKPFQVSKTGQIIQESNTVDQVQVMSVDAVDKLTKRGGTYFAFSESAKPSAVANPEIYQSKIETSNVPAPQAAVKLVGVLRQFEMLQRAVRLAGDMNKQAVEQVAKVSS